MEVTSTLTDHPGGDVGSPGTVGVAIAGVLGDYNNNGTVDAADYALWRNGGPLQNEGDTPGTVNQADYSFWRSRFGATAGSGAVTEFATVPEPSSAALAICATALYLAASLATRECRAADSPS
jgi:hypothetical protein